MQNNISFGFKKIPLEEWNSDINYICKLQLYQTAICSLYNQRVEKKKKKVACKNVYQ